MTPLYQKTYELLKQVPKGKVTTYKELATAAGTTAYRAIGQAMRKNPYAYLEYPESLSRAQSRERVPCHRVVASNGSIGGFMGKRNGEELAKKIKLLKSEGVEVKNNRIVDFHRRLYSFK